MLLRELWPDTCLSYGVPKKQIKGEQVGSRKTINLQPIYHYLQQYMVNSVNVRRFLSSMIGIGKLTEGWTDFALKGGNLH